MHDLDEQLDRELRALPAPQAPVSLLPRVLLAVAEADATPWYSRSWVAWPRGLQIASSVLLALIVAGLWWLVPSGQHWITEGVSSVAGDAWAWLAPVVRGAAQVTALVRLLWDVVLGPIAAHFLILTILVAFVCAVFWTAVTRVALGGAASQ